MLIPPHAVLIAKGKDGKPRVVPLNAPARNVFKILVEDTTTGDWLFTNRDCGPMKAIKKGFLAACERAEIEDLRHTFATRLVEPGVHHYVISALLGHSTPSTGFGHAPRITPGYGHVTWDTMVAAVKSLEKLLPKRQQKFGSRSGKSLANRPEERKVGLRTRWAKFCC